MDTFLQPAGHFSSQEQNITNSPAPVSAPSVLWYTEDSLSECSQLPSPICDDAAMSDSTEFYLDPLSLSSNFNDCKYNYMSLFDNNQIHDWLVDPDQDLNMSSPFSMAVASPVPKRNHESINCQCHTETFSPFSSSPPSDVGIARSFSQDLSLSAAEIQELTAVALGRLPPPLSPLSNPKLSQNLRKSEKATQRRSKTEVTTPGNPPGPDRKQLDGRAAAAKSAGSKRKPSKSGHNQVEKKYRTNLNSKIAALRDCMPDFRAQSVSDSDAAEEQDNRPISKAGILTAAIKRINTLEKDLEVQKREVLVLTSIVQRCHPKLLETVGLWK